MKKSVSFDSRDVIIAYEPIMNKQEDSLWYSEKELNNIRKSLIFEIRIMEKFSYEIPNTYPKIK